MIKKLFITSAMLIIAANTYAGQTIQLDARFKAFENHPIISFIIQDEDADTVTPYSLEISQKTFFRDLRITGNHYKVIGFTIQYNGGSYTSLCDLGQQVDNQATMITLTGFVGVDGQAAPSCSVKYTAVIPVQKAVVVAATNTTAVSNAATASAAALSSGVSGSGASSRSTGDGSQTRKGRKVIARYLKGLKNNCHQGRYAANISNQSVTYNIRGNNRNSQCEVDITAANGKPIRCSLSPADIKVLTTNDQINALDNNQSSTSTQAASVMQQNCHALS